MTNSNKKPLWIYIFKGAITAVAALILKGIVTFSTFMSYSSDLEIKNNVIYIISFVCSLFVYNSIFGIMISYDKHACEDFFKNEDSHTGRFTKFKKIYAHKSFITEYLSAVIVLSIAAALGAAPEISGMFYFGEGKGPHRAGIIPFLAIFLISSAIYLYNRYEAVRYWRVLKKQASLDTLTSKSTIIIRILVIVIGYPLVLPYIPLVALPFVALFGAAALLLSIPILLVATLIIFLLYTLFLFINAMRQRKKLIKELKTLVREHGLSLSKINNPYISLINSKKKCSFDLIIKNKKYNCLVIGHVFRSVPICFTSETKGLFRYRIGTKRHNISLEKHFEYSLDGDGIKILIISPTPKYACIYIPEKNKDKRIFNADRLWDFVAYETEAFLRATDRDCLGKYSSSSDDDEGVKIPRMLRFKSH